MDRHAELSAIDRTLIVAIGNPLRGDDGVAHRVLELLPPHPGVLTRSVLQLTPEMADSFAGFDVVVLIDADVESGQLRIEPVGNDDARATLTHRTSPAAVVAFARRLFAFAGSAFLCHIPAEDFSPGAGLSAKSEAAAVEAARRLNEMPQTPGTSPS